MALLVAEDGDVDAEVPRCRILRDGSCSFQGIDAAKRPIEPSRMVLAFQVRSRENLATALALVPLGAGQPQPLVLRGGRQVLAYGSERLISARYGPNVLRSFDATSVTTAGHTRALGTQGAPRAARPV